MSFFPHLGFGLGLRTPHYPEALKGNCPTVSWFEVVSENFLADGGRPRHILERIRKNYPIALHGVSLSIGSAQDWKNSQGDSYLRRLKNLVDQIQPAIVSDHCCWTGIEGENLHDLLPLPYTFEAIQAIVNRLDFVQNYLGRRILIENVSSYITFKSSEMTEWEFLTEISKRSDCGLLLDVNNVYVSAVNHGYDPYEFIDEIPIDRVGQIHLAGHSTHTNSAGRSYLIDTHDQPVCNQVWELYQHTVRRYGRLNTMIEWDAHIPEFSRLTAELEKARSIEEQTIEEQTLEKPPTKNITLRNKTIHNKNEINASRYSDPTPSARQRV